MTTSLGGAGEAGRPAAEHDDGDEHRDPHEARREQVAEQLERHAHRRQERSVVQVGPAVDQEAFRTWNQRVDGEPAPEEHPRLLVVEVGAEPGPREEIPRLPRRRHEPEQHHGHDRDHVDDRGRRQAAARPFRPHDSAAVNDSAAVTTQMARAATVPSPASRRTGRRTSSATRCAARDRRRRRTDPRRPPPRARRAAARRTPRRW